MSNNDMSIYLSEQDAMERQAMPVMKAMALEYNLKYFENLMTLDGDQIAEVFLQFSGGRNTLDDVAFLRAVRRIEHILIMRVVDQ